MSSALIDERPLIVLPTLAKALGLNRAVFLQQLHYWLDPKGNRAHTFEGRRWIYNTYKSWQEQFPWWSTEAIKKIVLNLEERGLIDTTDRFNKIPTDRTKWYTINYEKLRKHVGTVINAEGSKSNPQGSKSNDEGDKSNHLEGDKSNTLTIDYQETSNIEVVEDEEQEPILADDATAKCLLLLKKIKGFPTDQGKNAEVLMAYREAYPAADPIEVCNDLKAFIAAEPFKKGSRPRVRLKNFFKSAHNRAAQSNGHAPGTNGTPLPSSKKGTPAEIIDYVFENTSTDAIRHHEHRLRSTMTRFDFSSGEQPPWPIEKELGGTDNERWGTLDALRSLCRRGKREVGVPQ